MCKRITIILLLSVLPLAGMAQMFMEYGYDSGGNRIYQREYQLRYNLLHNNMQGDATSLTAEVDGREVCVVPSVENGQVRIEILGLNDDDNCSVSIFTALGVTVLSETITNTVCTFDVSQCPRGVYLIRVVLNSDEYTWRIVKKR